jgi:archaellum component FlaC
MNDKHYNKKWRKQMGGISLDGVRSEWIRGQVTPEHKIQESIDALNAAITRLDNIINEMKGQTNGNNN